MNETPLPCELAEVMRGELWPTIRPKNIWDGSFAECLSQSCSDLGCGGVMCHRNVRPVSVTVNRYQIIMASIRLQIHHNFLK